MSIAFKEWALICKALGDGTQSIILRKGGIAEGRDGFHFKHDEFFLFPTQFHEQVAKLKLPAHTPLPRSEKGIIGIEEMARVEWTATLRDLERAKLLSPFHIWRDEVVEERFRYDQKDELHLAFVRISRLASPCEFPDTAKYGGCRSWITIPDVSAEKVSPVLSETENKKRSDEIKELVGAP